MKYAYLVVYRDGSTLISSHFADPHDAWNAYRVDFLLGSHQINHHVFIIAIVDWLPSQVNVHMLLTDGEDQQ